MVVGENIETNRKRKEKFSFRFNELKSSIYTKLQCILFSRTPDNSSHDLAGGTSSLVGPGKIHTFAQGARQTGRITVQMGDLAGVKQEALRLF